MPDKDVTDEYLKGVLSYPAEGRDARDFQSMAHELLALRATVERLQRERDSAEQISREEGVLRVKAEVRASLAAGIALNIGIRDIEGSIISVDNECCQVTAKCCADMLRSLIPNASEVEKVLRDAEQWRQHIGSMTKNV